MLRDRGLRDGFGFAVDLEMKRNPGNPQRRTEAQARKTAERIDEYLGVRELLRTWELQPMAVQCREHDLSRHDPPLLAF